LRIFKILQKSKAFDTTEAFLDIEAYFSELLTSKWQTGSQVSQWRIIFKNNPRLPELKYWLQKGLKMVFKKA